MVGRAIGPDRGDRGGSDVVQQLHAACRTASSVAPRECDAVLYTRASTKTFLAQIATNYRVGLALAPAASSTPTRWSANNGNWPPSPSW